MGQIPSQNLGQNVSEVQNRMFQHRFGLCMHQLEIYTSGRSWLALVGPGQDPTYGYENWSGRQWPAVVGLGRPCSALVGVDTSSGQRYPTSGTVPCIQFTSTMVK